MLDVIDSHSLAVRTILPVKYNMLNLVRSSQKDGVGEAGRETTNVRCN
jgi:hypothetical protein